MTIEMYISLSELIKLFVGLNEIPIDSIPLNFIDFQNHSTKDNITLNILFHWRQMKVSQTETSITYTNFLNKKVKFNLRNYYLIELLFLSGIIVRNFIWTIKHRTYIAINQIKQEKLHIEINYII